MTRISPLFLLFSLLLAACSGAPSGQLAAPVTVALTPATALLEPAVAACGEQLPGVSAITQERFYPHANADLVIHLGEPQPFPGFAVPLAGEQVLVILHPNNPAASLTLSQVTAIFSGEILNWSVFGGRDQAIQTYAFYPVDETRQAFDRAVLAQAPLTPDALLVPHPQAMLQSVAEDPAAIGYLPAAFATDEVSGILLGLDLPVLSLAEEQPQGPALDLLLCLQSGPGQELIDALYLPGSQ